MYFTKRTLFLCVCALVVSKAKGEFKLLVLHTNDMHARFQETNVNSGPCVKSPCYGGFARLKTAVDALRQEARQEGRSSIFLNAGDTYQGTVFYTFYKHRIVSEMLNKLGIDAMSLGNHEFDDGPAGLTPFIANSSAPVLCCNLDYSREPAMSQMTRLRPSTVLDVDGVKVGVIGYLTPDTKFIAKTGEVDILDEVTEIRKEAARLKQEGVKILIALGHSGYATDKKIAAQVPDLDLVVGGHTNTFLYNGPAPSVESVEGQYPTVVTQSSGRRVLVVQAYAYTKYMGHLKLTFDDEGEVAHSEGNPILMDDYFKKDEEIDEIVSNYEAKIQEEVGTKKVGTTRVFLEADTNCRIRECNFGNLVTDAFVFASTKDYHGNNSWTGTPVAIVQGGGLRASISSDQHPGGAIMAQDLMTALPFENTVKELRVKGSVLKAVMEHSVKTYSTEDRKGSFLQYSGIQVMYDLSKPPGQRVVSAKVRCGDCRIPQYYPLDLEKNYTLLISTFLAEGGDGYTMLKNVKDSKDLSFSDRFAVEDYMNQFLFVYPEVSGRLQFLAAQPHAPNSAVRGEFGSLRLLLIYPLTALLLQSRTFWS